jgi:iron complex transport system substrate-binding protein
VRVVALTCSNTEIVCALGLEDLLVGVDDHSDHPAAVVDALPRVGPDLDIDVQRVAALEPDLVLASLTVPGHERIVERLEAAKLPFLAPETESIDDVYDDVRRVAEALGAHESGERVVAEMRAALTPAPLRDSRPSILVEWWTGPVIAPGRASWVNDLLEWAGATNPLGNEPVKSRPLSDEEVRELAPDAFVLSWCGIATDKIRPDVVLHNASWQGLEAIRCGHVFVVPEALLGRPSPRLVDGFRELRSIVEKLG